MVVTSQTLLMVATAMVFSLLLFSVLRAHARRQGAARDCGQSRRRAHRRHPAGAAPATLAFLLASLLGAISGILIGPVTTLYYDSGFIIGLKAFVGAIIGGLVSYPGTAVGAVLVGLLESFASFWSSAFKEVIGLQRADPGAAAAFVVADAGRRGGCGDRGMIARAA